MAYSDSELIAGIKKEDRKAESAFYTAHRGLVRDIVYKVDSSRRIDWEDFYQDVSSLVVVLIRRGKLDNLNAKLSTYVYAVAKRQLLYLIRSTKIKYTGDVPDQSDEPVEISNIDGLINAVLELIGTLSYPCNELLPDWYLRNMNFEEIAAKHKYKNDIGAKSKKNKCLSAAREAAKEIWSRFND